MHWREQRSIGAMCAMLVAMASGLPAATILPDPTAVTTCDSGQLGEIVGTTGCSQSDANGSDSLAATFLPFAGLSGSANVGGGVLESFGGVAALNYSFEVVGGSPGDVVPLLIFANLSTSVSSGGDGLGFSEILVSTALSTNVGEVVCAQTSEFCVGVTASNFSGAFGVNATSGTIDQIHLEIEVSVAPILPNGESATAFADPLIIVDPSFANADLYSIVVSPGVGNASAVPEPGTPALVACCLPLLLWARCRRMKAQCPKKSCGAPSPAASFLS
jgi:hypothetical protein